MQANKSPLSGLSWRKLDVLHSGGNRILQLNGDKQPVGWLVEVEVNKSNLSKFGFM